MMTEEIYDLIGIGFGPANLSLAIALQESKEASERGFKSTFLERQAAFAW